MREPKPAVLFVLVVGVVAVSCAALFVRLADAPALSTAALRMAFAAAPSLALLSLRGQNRREIRALSRTNWRLTLLSGLCLALHFATWIASLNMTTVSSSVALVTTSPLFVAGFMLVRGERVSRGMVLAILVCCAGGLIIGYADLTRGDAAIVGDLLALAGAAFAAVYLSLGRQVRRTTSLIAYVGAVYPIAALALIGLALAGRQPLSGFDGRTWLMFLLLALVPQLLGHTSLNWALGYLSAPFVALAVLGEPVIATTLAAVFLGEMPGADRLIGFAAVLLGVYLGLRAELREPSRSPRSAPAAAVSPPALAEL